LNDDFIIGREREESGSVGRCEQKEEEEDGEEDGQEDI
jgi:hypothetical protein